MGRRVLSLGLYTQSLKPGHAISNMIINLSTTPGTTNNHQQSFNNTILRIINNHLTINGIYNFS
jgi:hypothetical protein